MKKLSFCLFLFVWVQSAWSQELVIDSLALQEANLEIGNPLDTLRGSNFVPAEDLEYIPADETPELIADRLSCLQGADNAGDRAKHTHFRAVSDEACGRGLREQAAQRRVWRAVGSLLVRLEDRDVAVERAECGIDQRLSGEVAGISHEIAGGKVVGSVCDDVEFGNDTKRILGGQALSICLDLDQRIDALNRIRRALDFEVPSSRRPMKNLPLQIVDRNTVVVDHTKRADASRCQIEQYR